jgi:helix-turn-helix protein
MTADETAQRDLPRHPSIQQASGWLGVDPKTVRRYISQGRIKAFLVGPTLVRCDRESLLKPARPVVGVR